MRWVLILAGLMAVYPDVVAGHEHAGGDARWIMSDPKTSWCCGPQDCRPLDPARDTVVQRADGVWLVNGIEIAPANVFPTRDGTLRHWACFRGADLDYPKCLFVPGAM